MWPTRRSSTRTPTRRRCWRRTRSSPIVEAYAAKAGVAVETRDISVAARILAQFGLADDALGELGALAKTPEANIIKLPNISASIPQLKAAVKELQDQGFAVPDYPEAPATDEEREIRAKYDKVKGSAVNPVLREGNSDRRAPLSVKQYAKSHPHTNKPFAEGSKTKVATMGAHDFASNELSVTLAADDTLSIVLETTAGESIVLKESLPVLAGEIVDATTLQVAHLHAFLENAIAEAKALDVLFSVHLKATMMKVSDPIIFGHVVQAYFADVFDRYGEDLRAAGLSANDGLGTILPGLTAQNPKAPANGAEIKAAFDEALAAGPRLSYVNSDRGITNLHVPSDVIVDASMPALIRNGGRLWGADGGEDDTLAVIPDSSYAGVYQTVIADCQANGPLDPATIGSVPNVGLMAQAAEEYGSHDKTFEIPADGTVRVLSSNGEVLLEHDVETGDIWRACQTKDVPVRDWVKLAVTRARATGAPAIFWLNESRAHDARADQEGGRLPPRARHVRPRDPGPEPGAGHGVLAGADAQGRGHHLGHRQRAARLQHRPVPDPRARHLGEDALRGPADRRRRPLRDRRGWLGTQARPAAGRGELPALGLPR